MRIKDIIQVALGQTDADLLIRNARIVNVFSGEIESAHIAIHKKRIAGIGDYDRGREVLDLRGAFVVPGLIAAHLHIESSMLSPREFAQAVLPRGTTTIIADPHEIANVVGLDGVAYMLKMTEGIPLNVYVTLPSAVPATSLETSGARLGVEDMIGFLEKYPRVLALGEVMNYPGVLNCDPDLIAKIELLRHRYKKIDGHAPNLTGRQLNAYIDAFIRSDHESCTVEEAREKLAKGMQVFLREGSAAKNLKALLGLVNGLNHHFISLCTDDRSPEDILEEGHLDHMIRICVGAGIDPVVAIRMATINTARHFNLRSMGAIAPGYKADLLVVDDLADFRVRQVIKDGLLVAENGVMQAQVRGEHPDLQGAWGPMNPPRLTADNLRLSWREGLIRAIGVEPDTITTREAIVPPFRVDGHLAADPARDLQKIAVLDRYRGENFTVGFVTGLGLRRGAIGTSVGHDAHNVAVCGSDDADMICALEAVRRMQGGLVVCLGGKVLASLPLPICGLISDRPMEEVNRQHKHLLRSLQELGPASDVFMSLSFLQLPVIPHLKITDRGLVDVARQSFVSLYV